MRSYWQKWITKYANLVYFGKLFLLTLNLKFLLKNYIFWVWVQLTKWRSSTLVSTTLRIFKKFLILNIILLQFELRVYFQCLLNSIYIMTWKFNLHHDVHHRNIHTWLNFPIFYSDFLFDMIFLHFSSKILKKNNFPQINLKKIWSKEDM